MYCIACTSPWVWLFSCVLCVTWGIRKLNNWMRRCLFKQLLCFVPLFVVLRDNNFAHRQNVFCTSGFLCKCIVNVSPVFAHRVWVPPSLAPRLNNDGFAMGLVWLAVFWFLGQHWEAQWYKDVWWYCKIVITCQSLVILRDSSHAHRRNQTQRLHPRCNFTCLLVQRFLLLVFHRFFRAPSVIS